MKIQIKEEIRKECQEQLLVEGAWFLMMFGFDYCKFCIVDQTEERVALLSRHWCCSDAYWMTKEELLSHGEFLGHGRKNLVRYLVPFLLDLIHPYHPPRKRRKKQHS